MLVLKSLNISDLEYYVLFMLGSYYLQMFFSYLLEIYDKYPPAIICMSVLEHVSDTLGSFNTSQSKADKTKVL